MTSCPYCNVGGNPVAIERHIAAVHAAEEGARLHVTCNHKWAFARTEPLNRDTEAVVHITRCLDCNALRTRLPDGRVYYTDTMDIGATPDELAADLQALRTELQEEVTS